MSAGVAVAGPAEVQVPAVESGMQMGRRVLGVVLPPYRHCLPHQPPPPLSVLLSSPSLFLPSNPSVPPNLTPTTLLTHHASTTPDKWSESPSSSSLSTSQALNEQANLKFTHGLHKEAIQLYSKAISLAPQVAKYYSNRGAAWLTSGAAKECVQDCRRAIGLDPKYKRAHIRLSQALCVQGQYAAAVHAISMASSAMPEDNELSAEREAMVEVQGRVAEAMRAVQDRHPSTALALLGDLLNARSPPCVLTCAAHAHAQAGRLDQALSLGRRVLQHHDISDTGALLLCAQALYLKADWDQSLKHLRQLLKLSPDDSTASAAFKKIRRVQSLVESASSAMFRREFEAAVEGFTAALDQDPELKEDPVASSQAHKPLSALIYSERATALLRLKRYEECLGDARVALLFQSECRSAHLARASALLALERFEEAEKYLKALLDWQPEDKMWQQKMQKAQFEVRKRKRPDYYAVFGVPKLASAMEVKAAYKQRAMEWHPDKHDSDELKERAEEQFKLLGEGLEILSSEMKRSLYDEGYDKEAIEERYQAAQRASREDPKRNSKCGGGGCC
eukprot:CAMPEP_0196578772 /NCGR_PEP_ID=MMETSP1081-20130531/7610_1 /TAXON_ID=36882 /ORGANISM="Pyramimonas amylifera, Strain CCMP720" /LENGTH=563 /DNA_ID=CAMNT_0041898089 /DNA_START=331 /DNA_END=2023 /DNA_ORIENTATION=+